VVTSKEEEVFKPLHLLRKVRRGRRAELCVSTRRGYLRRRYITAESCFLHRRSVGVKQHADTLVRCAGMGQLGKHAHTRAWIRTIV
jgi:hypothetical protein